MLKITDILSRSQKLPSSVLLLKEGLESKKALYSTKAEGAEKRILKFKEGIGNHEKKLVSQVQSNKNILLTRGSHRSNDESNIKSQLEIANNRIESLSLELE